MTKKRVTFWAVVAQSITLIAFAALAKVTYSEIPPKPSTYFVGFTNYLDSAGYISDSSRARKVSPRDLSNSRIIIIDSKPFFVISPINHDVLLSKESLKGNYIFDTMVVDYDIFRKPTSILAYYYRQNIKSTTIEDGVIEEWNFASESEAKKAMSQLNKVHDLVYFNTRSFLFQTKNYLYIFHTRASAFDITLRKFYKTFKQNIK